MEVRSADTIRARLREAGADALWVHPSVDLRYLTGLTLLSIERPCGLLILADGGLRMVVPAMLAGQVEGVDTLEWTDAEGPEQAIAAALGDVRRCLVEPSLPYGHARLLPTELEVDPGIVAALRARKAADELELLLEAGRRADAAAEWLAGQDVAGRTERELDLALQAHFLQTGSEPYGPYIVATGPHGALPHHHVGETPIAPDIPLLCDFGCAVDGYYSDTTRVYFPPEVEAEVEEAYEIVLAAYDAAERAARPGMTGAELDRVARAVFEEAGHADAVLHRTGHGVGLEIHEPPYITEGNDVPLETGNVFSIEPGFYAPGRFGLRFENLVVLEEGGARPLNASPRRLKLSAAAAPARG
jgi:Xaa-Pro aminopeptidase